MKQAKRQRRSKVTVHAPRVSVPLIGWIAARQLAQSYGKLTVRLDSLESMAYLTFMQADRIVRREAK